MSEVHINRGSGKHKWLSLSEKQEKYPDLYEAMTKQAPFRTEGRKLAESRKSMNFTQKEYAERIGIRLADLSAMEAGYIQPSDKVIQDYALFELHGL